MTAQQTAAEDTFSLRRRNPNGGTAPLTQWGWRNETDPLTDVLLCKPTYAKHLATSSMTKKALRENPANMDIARKQHDELAAAYAHFGVKVHYMTPEPELPMQHYTRDSAVMTPWGPIITNMSQWWRRGENYAALRFYQSMGIPIYDMVTAGTMEGGDFNVIEDGTLLMGCGGARTQDEGAQQIKKWLEKEGWEVRISYFDEYYVHVDVMVMPIAPKLTAVGLDCTEPAVVQWLKDKGHEIIHVPFQDVMTLGCNFMALGKDRVIAPKSSQTLIKQLKARGFDVAEVELAELSKTGGGIHCMAQALRRVPA